jgi:hypothetical protein
MVPSLHKQTNYKFNTLTPPLHTSIHVQKVFVEIHYNHPDMEPWGWVKDKFVQSRSDAQALFTKARDLGMFIHPWP